MGSEDSDFFFEQLFDQAKLHKTDQVQSSLVDELQESEGRYGKKEYFTQGGMKKIFKVHDFQTDRTVAMACLDPEKEKISQESFLREARITAQLQHPNIIAVYDMGIEENAPFFTMKFLEGQTLERFLEPNDFQESNAKQSLPELLNIFRKTCDAVAYAHAKGVIHLDLKPANIHLSDYGEVTVCDWGLAKVLDQVSDDETVDKYSLDYFDLNNHTLDGYIKGTMGFMSPEQLGNKKKKDQRSDIYSLGAILYKILSQRQIIHAQSPAEYRELALAGKIEKPSTYQNNIPSSLEAVCMKCLQLEPEDRYHTVDQVIADLDAYLNGYATDAEDAGFLKQAKLFYQRNKAICLVSITSLLIVFTGLITFLVTIEKAYSELQTEKDEKQKISQSSARKYYEEAERQYKNGKIEEALINLKTVQVLDPSLDVKNEFEYEILLVGGHFEKLKAFPELDLFDGWLDEQNRYDLQFFTEFLNKLKSLKKEELYRYAQRFAHKNHLKTLDEQNEYLKISLLLDNPKITELKLSYDGQKLDLSHNTDLVNIDAVHAVDIYHLDLSHSDIQDLRFFKKNKIEELDLSSSQILYIPSWNGAKLKRLDLSFTPIISFSNMSRDSQYQIGELKLTGSAAFLEEIKNNQSLTKIMISDTAYKKQNLNSDRYTIQDLTDEEKAMEVKLKNFHKLNKSKDGFIDYKEFKMPKHLFNLWDKNQDKKLSTKEFMPLEYVRENIDSLKKDPQHRPPHERGHRPPPYPKPDYEKGHRPPPRHKKNRPPHLY